ncbi:ankyrin repeat-containing domain protein [Mycena galopus ATCC 62051]|nr:ankyrin repeat-containing domain protein [Mycena galopus ATCC 62051]
MALAVVNNYNFSNISGGTGGRGGDSQGTGGAGGVGGGPTFTINNSFEVAQLEKLLAEKLEKWLGSPPDMKQKQHDTAQLHKQGTGQWFLESEKFLEWEQNAGSLWIEGPSGAGKSVLSSMVIEKLFADREKITANHHAIAFFYFDFRNKATQSVEIALCRILLQLSAQCSHPYKTLDEYYVSSNGQKLPRYEDLQRLLYKLLPELGQTYIVLDALDECDSTNFTRLVTLVSVLRAWTETSLHLLITSQTRDVFTKGFNNVARIALDFTVTWNDIEFFVTSELQTNSDLEAWQPHATEVTEQITCKSNGMFRLAACLLIELVHYVYPEDEDLNKVLETLPDDLFGIYDRFMLAIPKEWFPYAEAALRWTMFNKGWGYNDKITLSRLADAIAFQFSDPMQYNYKPNRQKANISTILKWLTGLIQAGECYLAYFGDHPLEDEAVDNHPLANYAAEHWYDHLSYSNDKQSLLALALQLLKDDSKGYHALFHLVIDWNSAVLPPLYVCCQQGYWECVPHLLANGAVINIEGEDGNPLSLAAARGPFEIVQLLLEKGADINAIGGIYGSALGVASWRAKLEIVQLLLEKGADINLAGGEYGSALGAASYRGKLEIVQLLLEKGADINLAGGEWGSALGAASYGGKLEIVQLLLEKGADINLAGGEWGSALGAASYRGKLEIVQLLFEKGAEINLAGGEWGSALSAASYGGELEIVQLLLEKGAEINLAGGEWGSALGADINLAAGEWGSALSAASYGGELEIVQLLLEKGADINLAGGEWGSALGAASYRGELEIVQLLLEKGAEINLAGGEWGSALGAASYRGELEIVQLLLEKGADINLAGGEWGSALSAASYRGELEIVQLLLEKGADINLAGGEYGSALSAASYGGELEIVQLLLEKGADINLAGGEWGSALGAASYGGDLEIVQLLLEKGADINLAGGEWGSALGAASYGGELDIVQLLLEKGAEINLAAGEYGTALGVASFGGEQEVVQLLLEKGADISLAGGRFGSALAAASASKGGQPLDAVHFLLNNGADVKTQGSCALREATIAGHQDIVILLKKHGAVLDEEGKLNNSEAM